MNREMKRQMQRQGHIGADGEPLPTQRPAPTRNAANRPRGPRTTPLSYLRDVRAELKKVAWPTRAEVRNYSIVVIVTLIVMITLIFVLDYIFSEGAVFLFK